MKNCSLCDAKMNFLNTPLMGAGKLNDGGTLCSKCCNRVGVSVNVKNYSLQGIRDLLENKEMAKQDKELQKAEKKIQDEADKKAKEEQKQIQQQEKKELDQQAKQEKAAEKKERFENFVKERQEADAQKKSRLEEIKASIQQSKLDGVSGFLGRKEINELPAILGQTEQVDHIIQGVYNNGQGILVSTDIRLIFIDKGLLYGLKVEDFPLDKITSIQYETGLMFGKVKIHTSGNIANIEQVDKSGARKFAEFVREKLSRPKTPAAPVIVQAAAPQPDILEQLEKLSALKEKGILSDEEFAEQKKKLLDKL